MAFEVSHNCWARRDSESQDCRGGTEITMEFSHKIPNLEGIETRRELYKEKFRRLYRMRKTMRALRRPTDDNYLVTNENFCRDVFRTGHNFKGQLVPISFAKGRFEKRIKIGEDPTEFNLYLEPSRGLYFENFMFGEDSDHTIIYAPYKIKIFTREMLPLEDSLSLLGIQEVGGTQGISPTGEKALLLDLFALDKYIMP